MIHNLTGTHIILSYVFTLASIVVLWLGKKYIDTRKELKSKSIEEETKRVIAASCNNAVKKVLEKRGQVL
jgi:hypothetical protein